VHGSIREKPDPADAEVREDLAAKSNSSQNAAAAGLGTLAGAQFLVKNNAAGVLFTLIGGHNRATRAERCCRSVEGPH